MVSRKSKAYEVLSAVCCAAAIVLCATGATAVEIRGKVLNGTTGAPLGSTKVSVVDPRHGMATEEEIRTDAEGVFSAPGLSDQVSMFLVQVNYQGVTYTEIVQPTKVTVEIDVKVYETTTSWTGVDVSLPHFMARRSDDTLSIDRVFIVNNRTAPPKTVFGPGAGFKVDIPEDRLQITSLFATSLGFPISVEPHPTDTPGLYTIEYPFKPGETQVGVSFDAPYPESGYEYTESLPYSLGETVLMTEDPNIEVTSRSSKLGEPEQAQGFKAYPLPALPASTKLALSFRGGSAKRPSSGQPASAGHEIVPLREPGEMVSVTFIAALTLLLVLILAFASKSTFVDTDRGALLASRRDAILARLARLDDLFAMGAVAERPYRDKRAELVETLAGIMRRTGGPHAQTPGHPRKPKGTPDAR